MKFALTHICKLCQLWIVLVILCGILLTKSDSLDSLSNDTSYTPSHEARLREMLLSRYHSTGTQLRPVQDVKEAVTVLYGMRLIKMSVDETSQSLITSVWIRMRWNDTILKWNKDEYGGIDRLTFDPRSIWTPHDVTVANTVDTAINERTVDVKVRNTGVAFWAPHRQYKSECLLDLTYYPYDSHTCSIWIQSLAASSAQLNLQLYSHGASGSTSWELDTYMTSHAQTQEWQIKYNGSERVTSSRDHNVVLMYSNKAALRFTLTIQRRPGFVAYMLMFPGIILSFLATLTFCLPPERPDRNMLAMSLFMSFMVLLLILVDNVPPSARAIPKLVGLYCFNLALSVSCVFCSVAVINISRLGSETNMSPHTCLQRVFFGILARMLCVTRRVAHVYKIKESHHLISEKSDASNVERMPVKYENNEINTEPDATQQWKMIAFILDRCLFLFFIIANIVAAISFFPFP